MSLPPDKGLLLAPNTLYYGDNLSVLREFIHDESVDLIYLDPPFNSRQDYNVLFAEKDGTRSSSQIMAFEDTWVQSKGGTIRAKRSKCLTSVALALFMLICTAYGQNRDSRSPENTNAIIITFYYPTQRSWFNHSLGYQSDRPQTISDGKEKLIRLEPKSFVTLSLPRGEHQFWVSGCGANEALIVHPDSQSRLFVRVLHRRFCNSPEKSFEIVNCSTAAEEGGRMDALKAKNIFVPISRVVDTGAYFPAKCTE